MEEKSHHDTNQHSELSRASNSAIASSNAPVYEDEDDEDDENIDENDGNQPSERRRKEDYGLDYNVEANISESVTFDGETANATTRETLAHVPKARADEMDTSIDESGNCDAEYNAGVVESIESAATVESNANADVNVSVNKVDTSLTSLLFPGPKDPNAKPLARNRGEEAPKKFDRPTMEAGRPAGERGRERGGDRGGVGRRPNDSPSVDYIRAVTSDEEGRRAKNKGNGHRDKSSFSGPLAVQTAPKTTTLLVGSVSIKIGEFGEFPERRWCRHCGHAGITRTRPVNGCCVITSFLLLLICCFILPCLLVCPFLKCNGCKDVMHSCARCGKDIGFRSQFGHRIGKCRGEKTSDIVVKSGL